VADADCSPCCTHCGQRIEPRINKTTGQPSKVVRRFCSSRCMWAERDARRGPRHRPGKSPTRTVACHGCGITLERPAKRSEAGRYCSRKCNTDAMTRVAAEKSALGRIRDAWAWRPSALVVAEVDALRRIAKRTIRQYRTERGCTHCGEPVVGVLNRPRRCGPCKAKAHRRQIRIARAARKARIKGRRRDPIDPIAVFERDGWRCYLCGDETPRFLRGTHEPSAPELEHKVAIANGGTHTWDNVACACRACNQAKGARMVA